MRQLFKLRRSSRRDADHGDGAETTPFPPRFWWLKRLAAAYLIFVTCLALLYWAWTAYSHRQLASAIAEVQARGEPILYEDFDPPPIPADRNAANPLNQAAKLFQPDEQWATRLTRDAQYNVHNSVRWLKAPQDLAAVDQLIVTHQPALRLIRDARALDDADWGVRVRKKMDSLLVPHLNGQRDLAQFLAVAAFARHTRGDDAEAIELCHDLLSVSERVGDHSPFGVVEAVNYNCAAQLVDVVEQIAPQLDLREDARARASARALIADLLDERRLAHNRVRAAQADRTFAHDIFHGYVEEIGAVIEPAFRIDAARAVRQRARDVNAAARCASYADYVQVVPEYDPRWNAGSGRSAPRWRESFWREYPPRLVRQTRVSSTLFRNPRQMAVLFYRARCDRRAAAALLAARMYQLDHQGELPLSWDDLVPAYLPHAPADPFAPNAAPLKLLRRNSYSKIYSIGPDLADNGGAGVDRRGRPARAARATLDLVYGFPPPSPDDAQ